MIPTRPSPHLRRARPLPLPAALLSLVLLATGCSRDTATPGGRLPGDLDAELSAALATRDSPAVTRWVRREGTTRTKSQIYAMMRTVAVRDAAGYRRSVEAIREPVLDLAKAADDAFDVGLFSRLDRELDIPFERRRRMQELRDRRVEIDRAVTSAPEREAALRGFLAEARALDDRSSELGTLSSLGRCLADQTRTDEAFALYREALERAREAADRWYELQFLGVVGHYHEQAGEFDAMLEDWEGGMRLADRCRIAEQGARFRVFLANHYALHGRYSIARELLDEAEACVRDPSGREFEVRLVQRQMEFHATLACWEVVDGLLERQEEILRNPPVMPDPVLDLYRSRHARMAARREMARGDLEAAATHWDFAATLARNSPNREEWGDLLLERGQATLDAGRVDEARGLLEEGLAYSEANNLPHRAIRLRALAGVAAADVNPVDAAGHLDAFEQSAVGKGGFAREWALHDATRARLAAAAGDSAGARTLVGRAAEHMERIARATDPSGAGYLLLEQMDPVWRVGDALLRDDAEAGLRWEMTRRRLRGELGGDARGEAPPRGTTIDLARTRAALAAQGAVLIVWRVGPEHVDVWRVGEDGIVRDRAPGSTPACREATERFVDAVARGDGGARAAVVAGELLFPAAFREALETARRILFCPDGFVTLAPLELIPDADGEPLLEHHDVAVLRYHAPVTPSEATGRPLVVGPPALPREIARRWPTLANLDGAGDEARRVAALLGNARLLEGEHATKANVIAGWTCPVLHVSAHFVRDPLVPFVTFLPLAVAPDAPREQAVLDILDVRNASFRGTRLVVLSGCGSGAPWVGTVMAPGLGDAFLDAGAAAVLQTRWEIEDAFARDLVTEFTRRFAEGQDPVAALNAVKREARRGGMAPFHWASYSIVLGGPG